MAGSNLYFWIAIIPITVSSDLTFSFLLYINFPPLLKLNDSQYQNVDRETETLILFLLLKNLRGGDLNLGPPL